MKIAVIGAQYAPNRRRHGIENPTSGRFLVGEKSAAKGDAVMKRRSGHFGRMTILAGFAVRLGAFPTLRAAGCQLNQNSFHKNKFLETSILAERPFWSSDHFGHLTILADFTLSEKKTNNKLEKTSIGH